MSEANSCIDERVALLVIDIQEECTGPDVKPPHAYSGIDQLISNTNAYIENARRRGHLIVYVKHEEDSFFGKAISKVLCWVGSNRSTGAEIDARIKRASPHVFSKSKEDAFSNPGLELFLREYGIKRIELVGLDAAYCIQATALGGLLRAYEVFILTDAVVTNSTKHWEKIKIELCKQGVTIKAGFSW